MSEEARTGFALRAALVIALLAGVALAGRAVLAGGGAEAPVRLPDDWRRGMNVTAYSPLAYAQPAADAALSGLRATGTTHVSIVTNWYMDSSTSSAVAPDSERTPTDESVLHAMATARRLGLRVTLKPHVDVNDGSFRGDVQPVDRTAFFASYADLVDRHADLARTGGAEALVIGTELRSLSGEEHAWRDLITRARARFRGDLTYAANWIDEAEQVRFWDALDLIGIDAYMPLATGEPNPSVAQLEGAWGTYLDRIERLADDHGKPLVFTEIGYPSAEGAAEAPAQVPDPARPSGCAQARAIEAALRVFAARGVLEGMTFWEWSADGRPGGPADPSHRIQGKLAAGVIARWNLGGGPADPC